MSQGVYATIVGFVAQDPSIRTTQSGKVLTKMRIGVTPRYRDSGGHWHDSEPSYFDVACWGRLAHHVRNSLHKGEPITLKGRLRVSTFEDKSGNRRQSVEITADTVGHDLNRGPANYLRPQMQRINPEDDRDGNRHAVAADEIMDQDEVLDPDEVMDEEAIERFGQELDEADLAARAWRTHVGGAQDDEAPGGGTPDDEAPGGDTPGGSDAEIEADASGVADDPAVGTAPAVPAASY
jgi:single-strand DNA-binding protein